MKRYLNLQLLPWLSLCLGGFGLLLRLWLYTTGIDSKGLFITSHPANILLWVLTLVTLPVLYLCVKETLPDMRYSALFRPSMPAAVGCWVGAAGILFFSIRDLQSLQALNALHYAAIASIVTGVLSGGSLVYLGICRLKGIHPSYIFRAVICVFFMVHLICQYRSWSGEPELQRFFFQLLASICLMLNAYCRTALDTGKKLRCAYLFFQQAAIFFSCVSIKGTHGFLYLTMAIWVILDAPALTCPERAWRNG